MLSRTKAELELFGITFSGARESDVHISPSPDTMMRLEAPCELRAGRYTVGSVGAYTYLGGGASIFRHVARIGRYCSIATNITTGQAEHPTSFMSSHGMFQGIWNEIWPSLEGFCAENEAMVSKAFNAFAAEEAARFGLIEIGNDVWIGEGVFIRRGVRIGDGAIIGARSVVVRDVPPYSIVGGVPARQIRLRFSEPIIERLLALRWWDRSFDLFAGVDFTDIDQAVDRMEANLAGGKVGELRPRVALVSGDGRVEEEAALESLAQDGQAPSPD